MFHRCGKQNGGNDTGRDLALFSFTSWQEIQDILQWERDALNVQVIEEQAKNPQNLFFFLVMSPFSVCCKSASAPERLEAQKRKATGQTEKLYVQKKGGISFSPCDLPLISDLQKGCYLV